MIDRTEFCCRLRKRLRETRDKTLLRVAIAPDFDTPVEFTGEQLVARAEQLTSSLDISQDRSVVLLLLPHSPELFLLQMGLVLKGHIPAVLAWPTNRVDPEKYQRNLIHQLGHLPADRLLTIPQLAANLAWKLPYPVAAVPLTNQGAFQKMFPLAELSAQANETITPRQISPPASDALFLQFSGGTTGAQKAIVVTAGMLFEQLQRLQHALQFTETDSVVSWLPLYHDMGLIACYWMPLWHGAASTQIAANDWILNPELLLRYIGRHRATLSWLPNFAFSYLAQRREFIRQAHDLRRVRAWINCSEPVRLKSIMEFVHAFSDWGVRKESVQASYAMAETVFAVTQSQVDVALPTVSRNQIKNTNAHGYKELVFDLLDSDYVSSGQPIENTQLKILASDGSLCPDGVAGEIHVRTPSLFSGYWGNEGFQTRSLQNGWHATGDYGFLSKSELFVIGRLKDIIIVGGNNIFPEDVEAVVNTTPGIYPGRVVAFGIEDQDYGTQALAVAAEMKGEFEPQRAAALEAGIRKLVLTAIGTAPRHVAVVPERWIVKSTAGKISRRETRERFLREKIASPPKEVLS